MSFDLENAKLQVRNFIERYPINTYLVQASEKTKVEKEYIFLGSIAFLFLLFFLATGGDVIIDIVGFGYPFYMSLKAIETDDLDDDKQWLTYWIVFVLFKITENIADALVSFIPFYMFIKIGFLVWCCHPSFKGATLVYDAIIKAHIIPALGINKGTPAKNTKEKTVPHLELTIEKLVQNDFPVSSEDGNEGVFVEVAAVPPKGVKRTSGVEGTYFKTPVAKGKSIDFKHKVDISPLPLADGCLNILIKQKHTYGDDVVVADRSDMQISSFAKSGGAMVVAVGSFDITLSANYINA